MKNLLILTPLYPAQDLPKTDTPILHFFAKEWVRLGYNVRVVHYATNFPFLVNSLCKLFKNSLSAKAGCIIRTWSVPNLEYTIDGVQVSRIGLLKPLPHGRFPKNQIKKAFSFTIDLCNKNNFKPDYIIGHWLNPQLDLLYLLKERFNIPTVLVLHDGGNDLKTLYKKDGYKLMQSIDILGFRSKAIKDSFERNFPNLKKPSFMCYSGVPESYLSSVQRRSSIDTSSFIFVGTLIQRKNPMCLLESVCEIFGKSPFKITYVGNGSELIPLKNAAKNKNIEDKVFFLGRIPKIEVQKELKRNGIFVMVSRNEAFGLVYLEAMAAGCITIASKNEGMDGIIENGVNGFLCNSGDMVDLSNTINMIKNMSQKSLLKISNAAIDTVLHLSERDVAQNYMNSIINYK